MSSDDALESIKKILDTNNFDSASIEKIMNLLLVKDKNLILKTDIENSIQFTLLMVLQKDLEKKGLVKSARTLKNFLDSYIEVRVSRDRKSRQEILDAISAIKRENKNSLTSALLGMDNSKKGE